MLCVEAVCTLSLSLSLSLAPSSVRVRPSLKREKSSPIRSTRPATGGRRRQARRSARRVRATRASRPTQLRPSLPERNRETRPACLHRAHRPRRSSAPLLPHGRGRRRQLSFLLPLLSSRKQRSYELGLGAAPLALFSFSFHPCALLLLMPCRLQLTNRPCIRGKRSQNL